MLTVVMRTTNPLEAHILGGRFEAEGIPAFILFEHHVWAKWTLSNALGGVRLLVPQEKRSAARQVISDVNAGGGMNRR